MTSRSWVGACVPKIWVGRKAALTMFCLLLWSCSRGAGGPSAGSNQEGPDREPVPEGPGFPLEMTDASGAGVTFPRPPQRIVSLIPSLTRTLQALGAQDRLVARTDYDTLASLRPLPSVGGGLSPSLESLVAQDPDLVLRFAGGSDPVTQERLGELGVPQFSFRLDGIDDVRNAILQLARITGTIPRGKRLVAEMDTALAQIRERVEGMRRVRVAYVLGGDPPWVAGPGTYIDELLTLAGGENAFSDLNNLYGPVSQEEFRIRPLDLVIIAGDGELALDLDDLPLARVSPDLEIPGPELARSARELAEALHPEAFR